MCGSFLIFANALQCSATVLRWMQILWPLYPYREESRLGQVQSSLVRRTNSVLFLRPLHPAITIRATQPKLLASAVPRFGASCGNIMEMVPPKIIEQGVVPASPASPSIKKNAALGGLACVAAACGVITLKVIMNDTIRSEEDVGKYLGMSVLASVPDDDGMAKEQQRNRSKRKLDRKRRRTEKNRKGE